MGWNISHGSNAYGEERRSYGTVSNLATQLAHVLPASDWNSIRHLFNRGSGDPFDVPAHEAAGIARVLRKAASSRLMPAEWETEARLFADAAGRAANSGQPWRWS